jgi:superfamily II DNA or RNA helicase
MELFDERDVVLAMPIGSGKSMVAVAAHSLRWRRGALVLHGAAQGAGVGEVL